MMEEKSLHQVLFKVQKVLEVIYFIGSLWLAATVLLTIPLWGPIYLCANSMSRTLAFLKKVIDLPNKLFRPSLVESVEYAVLKGNGKYLKGVNKNALLFQLYDYGIRKFLSIDSLDQQMKICEVQGESLAALNFIHEKNSLSNHITCLQSHPEILEKQVTNHPQVKVVEEHYQIEEFSNDYDCMIVYNIKEKLNKFIHENPESIQKGKKVDILKILAYLKHHLDSEGYVIFGDFLEEGEMKVLEDLFTVYGFDVQQCEDIHKNVSYAKKLGSQLQEKKYYCEDKFLSRVCMRLQALFGKKRDDSKRFIVYILLKKDSEKYK